jgi:hypothetical protein
MNIFATSHDPAEAAVALDDKRCGKMLVEAAQLFASALAYNGVAHHYRLSHTKHPCAIWAQNLGNLQWLVAHASSLATEFEYRFGKVHKSWSIGIEPYLDALAILVRESPEEHVTEFARCCRRQDMNIDYTSEPCVVTGYRLYLSHRWDLSEPRWTKTPPPWWYFRDDQRA